MLEAPDRSHSDYSYGKGYERGERIGTLKSLVLLLKHKGDLTKERKQKALFACYFDGIVPGDDPEESADLYSFVAAYGTLDHDTLARRIMMESEFLHCRPFYVDDKSPEFLEALEREERRLLAQEEREGNERVEGAGQKKDRPKGKGGANDAGTK